MSLLFGLIAAVGVFTTLAEFHAVGAEASVARWPQFRGPGGSGVAATSDFPIDFGAASNVVWQIETPPGHSSPCIWDDRIFLTAYRENQLETLCLDRRDGTVLWRRAVPPNKIEKGSNLSNPAASTPATDGLRVYVYFGSFGLICYDFAGTEQWRRPIPTPVTQHGASTSPVVAGDRVLLNGDQDTESYLLAVACRDGATIWRTERSGYRRGFTTPLLWPPDRPECVVLPGTLRVTAYSLSAGVELWSVGGLPNEMVASAVAGDGWIYAGGWTHGSGVPKMPLFEALLEQGDQNKDSRLTRQEAPSGPARQHFLYIDADKDGFMTRPEYEAIAAIFTQSQNALLAIQPPNAGTTNNPQVQWKQTRGLPYVPTPLFYEGRIYLVKNGGLASCLDARTGQVFYQEERMGALGDYYSSPVAARGKICVASQQGTVVIFKAGDTLEILARNSLKEPILATPAIADDTLYVRTDRHLFAFGKRAPARGN